MAADRPAAERPNVEILGVSKSFGDVRAVEDFSLEIAAGSFTTLLGPSGCGKTTTLRMLAGFYDPDQGDIRIGGVSQRGVPPNRRNVSIVFQDYALFPHMTVLQNVSYGLRFRRLAREVRERRVARVMDFLGLSELADRHPHELSGGQQQRVALGRSIVMEPDVLLMDEPLSNLDAKLRIRVRAELKEIQRATGITTVYVTHDQDEALSLSDAVAVMADGRLQQYCDPWELYHEPANRFVADFVGYANVVPAKVVSRTEGSAVVVLPGSDRTLRCVDHGGHARAGSTASIMLRPEWFELRAVAGGDDDAVDLTGDVVSASFQGAFVRAWLRVPGVAEPLVVESSVRRRDDVIVGTRLHLRLPHDRAVVIGDFQGPA